VLNKACYFIRQQSTITTKGWDALEDMTGGNMRNPNDSASSVIVTEKYVA
jgi:hypothetical protein